MTEIFFSIKEYIEHRLAEHEVLLSFLDDELARAFETWWVRGGEGRKAFADWLAKSEDFSWLLEEE